MTSQPYPPRPHRLSYIFKGLLSHIITGDLDLASNLPIGIIGHADPARLGDAFQPCGDVNAVAEDITIIKNDVTDMDADAKFDPLIRRHGDVLLSHTALNFNRIAHRIDCACEFDQHAVAGRLDDAASMRGDCGVNKRLSDNLEAGQRAFLISTH